MSAISSPTSSPPRLAVVGCGYWGRNLVRNFHALGALAAVVDATPAGRELAAQLAPGAEVLPDLAPVLARQDLTAIVLSTPAVTHAPLGLRVLESGKDLFVEKPMALELSDGRALVARAAERKRILQVGHLLEYHPAVTALQSWVTEGRLGRIRRLHAHRLNFGKLRTEEDALWSLAPHDVSVILRLHGGMPIRVSCHGTPALGSPRADFTVAILHFPDGVEAHLLSSWLNPLKEQKIVVVGDRGMAVFDDTSADQKLIWHDLQLAGSAAQPELKRGPIEIAPLPKDEPLRLECAAFLAAVATRRAPLADGESGLRVLAVLDACRRSMNAQGQSVAVEKL